MLLTLIHCQPCYVCVDQSFHFSNNRSTIIAKLESLLN